MHSYILAICCKSLMVKKSYESDEWCRFIKLLPLKTLLFNINGHVTLTFIKVLFVKVLRYVVDIVHMYVCI